MPAFKRYLVPIVALSSMLGPFAIDTYLPSFHEMADVFGVSLAHIAQSLAIFLIAFAVGTLIWGPLIDTYGRKLSAIISLLGFAVASLICALAPNYETLMVGRLFQGLLASGSMIAGQSMVRDIYDGADAQKTMSKVMLMFALAPALAPILGGVLHDIWGWRSVFLFLTLYGLALATVLWLIGEETLKPEHKQTIHYKAVLTGYRRALTHARYLGLVLSLSMVFGGLFIYIAGSATLVYDFLHLGANDFALFFIPMVAGMMLGSLTVSRLAHNVAINKMVQLGFAIMAVAMTTNLFFQIWLPVSALTLIAPMALYSFGLSIVMPNLSLLAMDCFPKNIGLANGMRTFLQMGTNALVAAIISPLVLGSSLYFALGLAVFFVLGAGLYWKVTTLKQPEITQL
ncbi:MAG: multidrug effflux MFS transporter [Thiotrichales bacterium]|nr:multidrug effflux MFS transporter [Thiotrichales bacterium]